MPESAAPTLPPNSTPSVDATLSLAIKPLISAVQMRQSPIPSGRKSGTRHPAIPARMLSPESLTKFRRKSKLCKNQTAMVAK